MPPKLTLNFTPIATCSKNKDQHPGWGRAEGAGSGNDKVMNGGHGPSRKSNTILNEKNSEGMQGIKSPRGTRNEVLTPAEENGYLSDVIDRSGDDSDYRMGEPGPESEDKDKLDINKEKQSVTVVMVKKKEKPRRADIIALRRTEPASGTPNINKCKVSMEKYISCPAILSP
ncbi:hypothetical protein L208DRAFT_1375624 [Tricholoma matsutake]|nr:hypothetical protein L208DRAFT_1375624 [Tricholoma matsutake 945]